MGRFSPTVLPHALDLGGALTEGMNSYLQGKQLQDQRDELAWKTGIGIKFPAPETTQYAPVSIMGTSAPAGPAQTPQSAALPGVAGLPSPGRIQGMNLQNAPPSDLGPALQTGQQRAINGVAQPHDDLRDAISHVGKQVTADSQQPIMSLASQAYTPPPTTKPIDENTMVTLPSGRQMPYGQTSFGRQQTLLGEKIGGQYGMQNLRGQQRLGQIAMTTQGRIAVADENGLWHDSITGEQIASRELIAGQNNATRVQTTGMRDDTQVKTTGMRDDTSVQTTEMRDNTSTLNHNTPSGTAIYRTDHPAAGKGTAPETQAHFRLRRVPQLMKPVYEGGMGLSQDAAEAQATSEYVAANKATPPSPPPHSGGAVDMATRVQQLKASGMTKDQARQQLLKEGYQVH